MLPGANVGTYAALNMLIEFGPPNVTDTQDGVLKLQVENAYASKARVPAPPPTEIGGAGFCAPHTLPVPSRLSRKFCVPAQPTTLANDGGVEPSSAREMLNVVMPIGTLKASDSGLGPAPSFAVSEKAGV